MQLRFSAWDSRNGKVALFVKEARDQADAMRKSARVDHRDEE
jgi:hypothetical protein